MTNIFDSIQNSVFATVANTFGYAAKWLPSDDSAEQSAIVLYKDATEKEGLSEHDYNIERYTMEFKKGDFEGLKLSVDGGGNEKVRIEIEGNWLEFYVRRVETKFDGKTIVAFLNPPS